MRFKPIKGNVLCFGPDKGENRLAVSILQDARVHFTERPFTGKPSGFPSDYPSLVVNNRPYYGLEKIKRASMNIYAA